MREGEREEGAQWEVLKRVRRVCCPSIYSTQESRMEGQYGRKDNRTAIKRKREISLASHQRQEA